MEAQKFCMNIGHSSHARIKLPIGYRFHPTDEELVFHYLRPKVFGMPLPASIIPNFDVFFTSPWDLPGDVKEKRYFFSKCNQRTLENSCKIVTAGLGYWKHTGKGRKITAPGTNKIVGSRRTLFFRQKKSASHGLKTKWFMHRYELLQPEGTTHSSSQILPNDIALGDWVVYCVFQRKRRPKKNEVIPVYSIHHNSCYMRDFVVQDSCVPKSCSPCSSAVTEDSSNALDQEASSTYRG